MINYYVVFVSISSVLTSMTYRKTTTIWVKGTAAKIGLEKENDP